MMDVKGHLEKLVSECTVYPTCRQQRAVFYAWNQYDEGANTFCRNLESKLKPVIIPLPVKDASDFVEQLNEQLNRYETKIKNHELPCLNGAYVLVIHSDAKDWIDDGFYFPSELLQSDFQVELELCWIPGWDGKFHNNQNPLDECRVEWRVSDDFPVVFLLYNACYAQNREPLIYKLVKNRQPGCVYELKCKEYNAARDAICKDLLGLLQESLENQGGGRGWEESDIAELMEPFLMKAMGECPLPGQIPIVGYEKLKTAIKERSKACSKINKIKNTLMRKNYADEKPLDTEHVLSMLFGAWDIPMTEWMKKKIYDKKWLDALFGEDEEERACCLLREHYPAFVRYGKEIRKELEDKRRQEEQRLKDILQRAFLCKSASLQDIFKGLEGYFKCWEECAKANIRVNYWNKMIWMLNNKESIRQGYREVEKAQQFFENSRILACNLEWDSGKGHFPFYGKLSSVEDLIEAMDNYRTKDICFSKGMIGQIIQGINASIKYNKQGTGYQRDYNADESRVPKYFYFIHEQYRQEEEFPESTDRDIGYEWCSYMPKQVFLELRIYSYKKQKEGRACS